MHYFKSIFSIFIFFSLNLLYSQNNNNPRINPAEQKYKDCDLQVKNKEWLNLIKAENTESKKIELIKRKIEFDTVYKRYDPKVKIAGSSINLENVNSNGNLCGFKILFIFEYKKKKNINIDLNKNPNTRLLLNKINENNTSIHVLNQQQGTAIYGNFGSSGIIYLKTKDKELKKIAKRIYNKNSHYY